jgi:hypothetical protein
MIFFLIKKRKRKRNLGSKVVGLFFLKYCQLSHVSYFALLVHCALMIYAYMWLGS